MALIPVAYLIAHAERLFGVAPYVAAGALNGVAELEEADAAALIEAWLGSNTPIAQPSPTGPGGGALPDRSVPVLIHGQVEWLQSVPLDLTVFGMLPGVHGLIIDAAIEAAKVAMPNGGVMELPLGGLQCDVNHDLTAAPWILRGKGSGGQTSDVGPTTIYADTDRPGAVFSMAKGMTYKGFSLIGPGVGSGKGEVTWSNAGNAPQLAGIDVRDGCKSEDVYCWRFARGYLVRGNHTGWRDSGGKQCLFNASWTKAGPSTVVPISNTHGNPSLSGECDFTGAGIASWEVAGDSKIDSPNVDGITHLGNAPWGILVRANNPADPQEAWLSNASVTNISLESCGLGYWEDEGFNTANARMIKGVTFVNPLTGPLNGAYAPSGGGAAYVPAAGAGTFMGRVGQMIDVRILGRPGDSSNHAFGLGNLGFVVTTVQSIEWYGADLALATSIAAEHPLFRVVGSGGPMKDVHLWTEGGTKHFMLLRVSPGEYCAQGQVVAWSGPGTADDSFGFVRERVAGGGAAIGVHYADPNRANLLVIAPVLFTGGSAVLNPLDGGVSDGRVIPVLVQGAATGTNGGNVNADPTTGHAAEFTGADIADKAVTYDDVHAGNVKQSTSAGVQSLGVALGPLDGNGKLPWQVCTAYA